MGDNNKKGSWMEPPSGTKGEIIIRTKFNCGGLVRADEFTLTPQQMLNDTQWQKDVGLIEGPHCIVPDQLDIPF